MDPLLIDASAGSATISSVAVHPVVLFSVLDHHVRRNTDQDRVIGMFRLLAELRSCQRSASGFCS